MDRLLRFAPMAGSSSWITAVVWPLGLLAVQGCTEPDAPPPEPRGEVLVPAGASWRHSVARQGPSLAWAEPGFDDASWSEGLAPLGRAMAGLATELPDPAASEPPHLTVYFRHAFELPPDSEPIQGLVVRYQRDDGLRVLLNGEELLRHNLPAGALAAESPAPRGIRREQERRWHRLAVPAGALRRGLNLLAAELHQDRAEGSDLRFALELRGFRERDPVGLVRGPYLQQVSERRALVRFDTDRPARAWAAHGPRPDELATRSEESEPVRQHAIALTNLYERGARYYAIGVGERILAGGDESHRIPRPGRRRVRVWITGDQGAADEGARAVRDGMLAVTRDRPPGLWVTLGDNAYPSGSEAELQDAVFDTYRGLLRRIAFRPAPGNHDMVSAHRREDVGPYFDVFSPPSLGEAGGVPSGRERWYAFDWGPLHVVSLDTVSGHRAPDGPMLAWLERDLAEARQTGRWLLAAFHHPPYSRGSHDSAAELATSLVRERIVPILEGAGVDVVFAGHSHSYERSALGEGAVYVVSGHGSLIGSGPLDHPRMVVSREGLRGSILLDADRCRLELRAIDEQGEVFDRFELARPDPCPAPRGSRRSVLPSAPWTTSSPSPSAS